MRSSIRAGTAPATLKMVTYRQLVKASAAEPDRHLLGCNAVGRRPADLTQLDLATAELTNKTDEELTASSVPGMELCLRRELQDSVNAARLQDKKLELPLTVDQGVGVITRQSSDNARVSLVE